MASIVSQIVVVLVNRELSDGSVGVTVKISSNVYLYMTAYDSINWFSTETPQSRSTIIQFQYFVRACLGCCRTGVKETSLQSSK